jgi:hypothetical protein
VLYVYISNTIFAIFLWTINMTLCYDEELCIPCRVYTDDGKCWDSSQNVGKFQCKCWCQFHKWKLSYMYYFNISSINASYMKSICTFSYGQKNYACLFQVTQWTLYICFLHVHWRRIRYYTPILNLAKIVSA